MGSLTSRMDRIRVMVIADLQPTRQCLAHAVGRDPRLEVVAAVDNADEGMRTLDDVSPDVLCLDLQSPEMNAENATRLIMKRSPTPIVVSARVDADDATSTLDALNAGALAAVARPEENTHERFESSANHLCTQLALMSQVNVRRSRNTRGPRGAGPRMAEAPIEPPPMPFDEFLILGIVASTGSLNALLTVLNDLTSDFPLPIVLVQHITDSFHAGLVSWLDLACPFSVQVARKGQVPRSGHVYVAPVNQHLLVEKNYLWLDRNAPVCARRPSGDVLFQYLAFSFANQALAVLLSGMGEDGAAGLRDIRSCGGYTIAEDESTAVVHETPALALRVGGVCESLPSCQIGSRLRGLTSVESRQRAVHGKVGT